MTKRETIDAFIRGDIDRRTFMGRLTTLGVSAGAAMAYASTLGNSALASPGQNAAGFVVQGQDDNEYGVPNPFPLEEGLAIISEALDELTTILEGLGDFAAGDFADGIFEGLETIQEQIALQFEALGSLFAAGPSNVRACAAQGAGDPDAFLQSLATAFDDLTARFAAVVPGTDEPAARQAMMNVAMVTGRQAGFVSFAAGNDPFPSAFQEPMTAES